MDHEIRGLKPHRIVLSSPQLPKAVIHISPRQLVSISNAGRVFASHTHRIASMLNYTPIRITEAIQLYSYTKLTPKIDAKCRSIKPRETQDDRLHRSPVFFFFGAWDVKIYSEMKPDIYWTLSIIRGNWKRENFMKIHFSKWILFYYHEKKHFPG